ncbi:MAG: glycosyltransferase family 4 protein [Candidatus Omnitrophica bacterium]|nr:glycosyltransferase family 4 protein [Candidatus Omnitrophota bacterium]
MRLGIDAREIERGVSTGIGRALFNFLRYASETLHNDRLTLFSSRPLPFSFGSRIENHVMLEDSTRFWDQVKLPLAMKNQRIEVFYSPYYKLPLLTKARCVCAVLDLIYLRFPKYRSLLGYQGALYYHTFGRMCLNKARKILTCSQFSKDDIMKVYGISRKKIEVIPLSVSSAYSPDTDAVRREAVKAGFGIRGRYLLYAGNFKEHKNVPVLLEAFRQMEGYQDLQLVLVGPRDAGAVRLTRQAEELGIDGQVVFTDRIVDETVMRTLYSGAELFVMPSLYEGFGLPPVEAMACGTPVVCSKATSLPEAVGDAAVMIDATRPEEIAHAAVEVLRNDTLRKELVRRGVVRAAQLSEQSLSKRMFDFLRDMVL